MSSLQAIPGRNRLAFLPQDIIRFSFPQRPTTATEWIRLNGETEYAIRAGRIIDVKTGERRTMLPSGKIARILLLWFCTQAKLTKNPKIELKPSMRSFLKELGIPWNSNNAHEVSNQLQALLNCSLQMSEKGEKQTDLNTGARNLLISDESSLWFTQGNLSEKNSSYIHLASSLYNQLSDAVPLSLEACQYLQSASKSPMVLDIYFWLCLRLYHHGKASRVSWNQLYEQFGTASDKHKFKQTFRRALEIAREAYPSASIVEVGNDGRSPHGFKGFLLYPSPDPRQNFQNQVLTG